MNCIEPLRCRQMIVSLRSLIEQSHENEDTTSGCPSSRYFEEVLRKDKYAERRIAVFAVHERLLCGMVS